MTPAMAARSVAACMVIAACLAPATADFATYLKFGEHAQLMQLWKSSTKAYVNSLDALVNYLRDDTLGLNSSIQSAMSSAERQTVSMDILADNLLTRLSDMANNVSADTPDYVAPVAFQAYVVAGGINPLVTGYSTLKYGNVILNDGDHYSSSTGLFTAPVTGLYWFHATLTVPGGKREVYIKKNKAAGGSENIAYLNYYISQETACTTVTILHPGDTVGIYPIVSAAENWSLTAGYGNTFAGYMVATYEDPDYVAPANNAPANPATTAGSGTTAAPSTAAPAV